MWWFQVPGEASETDSEGELDQPKGQPIGVSPAGSYDNVQILRRDLPPLIVVRDHPDIQSVVEDRWSPVHRPHGEELHNHYPFMYHVLRAYEHHSCPPKPTL